MPLFYRIPLTAVSSSTKVHFLAAFIHLLSFALLNLPYLLVTVPSTVVASVKVAACSGINIFPILTCPQDRDPATSPKDTTGTPVGLLNGSSGFHDRTGSIGSASSAASTMYSSRSGSSHVNWQSAGGSSHGSGGGVFSDQWGSFSSSSGDWSSMNWGSSRYMLFVMFWLSFLCLLFVILL